MYCNECGSEITTMTCPVCGRTNGSSNTLVARKSDPVTGFALASWWRRVGGTLIDDLIQYAFSLLATIVAGAGSSGAVVAVAGIIFSGFYTVSFQVYRDGQTLGNRVAKTRVITATGTPLVISTALVRWGVLEALSILLSLNVHLGGTKAHPTVVVGSLGFGLTLLALVNYLWPLWDKRSQALHDKVAKTLVVEA